MNTKPTISFHLRVLRIAAIAIAATAWPAVAWAGEAAPRPWRVVMLSSADSLLPANIAADAAFREGLAADGESRVEVFPEFLDTFRFPANELDAELLALLRRKYGARPPHLVLASGASALRFAERHHDDLWPGAIVVFMLVDEAALAEIRPKRASYGVTMRFDIPAMLQLASRLLPDARQVVFVSGTAEYDRQIEAEAREAVARYRGPLRATFLSGLPLDEAAKRVSALPRDAIVISLMMFRDGNGQALAPVDAAARIARAASVPAFYLVETGIGRGLVGGTVNRPAAAGQVAAALALAALSGSPVSGAPIRPAPSACILDWRELKRWNIDLDRVPADCELRFRKATMLEQYWREALALAMAIALQAALIAALLIQLQRRRTAELESELRGAQAAHATRLATVGEITASIAHEINQPLGAILSYADAAQMIMEAKSVTAENQVHGILDHIRDDALRASEVIRRLRGLLGHRELDARPVDVNHVVAETVAIVSGEAARRGVSIVVDLDDGLPRVLGDAVHLQQVFLNLVVNAMDATAETAGARLAVQVRTTLDAGGARIEVADGGPGIAAENLPRLFDSFFTTKKGGLGLGLAIVRTIVEAHAGRLSAANGAGRGAVFAVWLPAA